MLLFKNALWIAAAVVLTIVCWISSRPPGHLLRQPHHRRLHAIWSDPKTLHIKQATTATESRTSNSAADLQSLRYVAFGTSRTWGAGLDHPEREAYIKLLSPNALNLGLRATLSDYPSLCLHSMIGDSVFDVIIVEFPAYTGKHDDFARLVQRLRGRFPHAIILYLPVGMPMNEFRYQNDDLQSYLRSRGITSSRHPAFAKTVRHLNDADLEYVASAYQRDVYDEIVYSVGGYVLEFPTFVKDDVKNYIIDSTKYYGSSHMPWDTVHPSTTGHEQIAENIRQLVVKIRSQPVPLIPTSVAGSWTGKQDRCLSWFPNGNITEDIREVNNMMMVNFAMDQEKWALEVYRTGGSFSVFCSFPQCNIYLSFMAMGPERKYPRAFVSVNGNTPILVDTYITQYHLRQIAYVGTVEEPGWATVKVDPLPDGEMHFRITGVITTPSQVN